MCHTLSTGDKLCWLLKEASNQVLKWCVSFSVHHTLLWTCTQKDCWLMGLQWHWSSLNLFSTEPLMCCMTFGKFYCFFSSSFLIYIFLYLFILILDYLLWWKERFNRDIQEASVTYFNPRTVFSQANIAPNHFSFVFWWFFKQQLHNMHIKLIWFVILVHHGQCAQLHALTLRAKSVFLRCKTKKSETRPM